MWLFTCVNKIMSPKCICSCKGSMTLSAFVRLFNYVSFFILIKAVDRWVCSWAFKVPFVNTCSCRMLTVVKLFIFIDIWNTCNTFFVVRSSYLQTHNFESEQSPKGISTAGSEIGPFLKVGATCILAVFYYFLIKKTALKCLTQLVFFQSFCIKFTKSWNNCWWQ